MMKKFTFKQDLASSDVSASFNVHTSAFGDGYDQHSSVGINNRKLSVSYQRTAKFTDIEKIKQFFDEHKGAKPFLYSTKFDGEIRVIAGDYQIQNLGHGLFRINCTFTQVFHR